MSRGWMTAAAALAALATIATAAYAFRASEPEVTTQVVDAAEADVPDGLLAATGVVRMPDGSPAAGASVRPFDPTTGLGAASVADEEGRFRVADVFGASCKLYARSTDGRFQAAWSASAIEARGVLAAPIELTLQPADEREVTVLAEGRPAQGAVVAATGVGFQSESRTGPDGKAKLLVPEGSKVTRVVAWHQALGAGGRREGYWEPWPDLSALKLLPPAPHRLRVVDDAGAPVAGVDLRISFQPVGGDWISTSIIDACRVRTDADGTAVVPWAPRDGLQSVDVDIVADDWKVDEARMDRGGRATTVRLKREREVRGRLVMPAGEDARGILVSGFGFGRTSFGVRPFARAGRDGSFRLRAPADHGLVFGLADLRWAADPWTGVVVPRGSDETAEIVFRVYHATPLVARVTRGPGREPVPGALVWVNGQKPFEWADGSGERHRSTGGTESWLTTDADGVARAGLGRGDYHVGLGVGEWCEKRTIRVTSAEPVEVDFHRDWIGDRHLTGRLTIDGGPFRPSPKIEAFAWPVRRDEQRPAFVRTARVEVDGRFDLPFDAETASVLFLDRELGRSGFVDDRHGEVDVAMQPTGVVAGVLEDDEGRGLAARTLGMYVAGYMWPIASLKTDQDGRFRFDAAPAGMTLRFHCADQPDGEKRYIAVGRKLLPGEHREDETLTARRLR